MLGEVLPYDGPAWAAPDSAVRLRTGAEASPPGVDRTVFGCVCRALVNGAIDTAEFVSTLTYLRKIRESEAT